MLLVRMVSDYERSTKSMLFMSSSSSYSSYPFINPVSLPSLSQETSTLERVQLSEVSHSRKCGANLLPYQYHHLSSSNSMSLFPPLIFVKTPVLTRGALDDGRGKARVSLFRHKHEIETGRTSSVGMEIMGFDSEGAQTIKEATKADEPARKMSWEEICDKSAKVISFIVSPEIFPP